MAKSTIIIGGGIIGLCSAYYLRKEGFDVTVIERGDITDGCSFGNMGYMSPSHFMPLASPGIIAEGFKHMLNSKSPFYVKPRLSRPLLQWGFHFIKNSNEQKALQSALHLHAILLLSRNLIADLQADLGDVFNMQEIGCLMMCKKETTLSHEFHLADAAEKLGLKVKRLSGPEVQALEPEVEVAVSGAVMFQDDCHFDPAKLMLALKNYLQSQNVTFHLNTTVTGFEKKGGNVTGIITDKEKVDCENLVIAAGSWIPQLAKMLGTNLLLQPGKGYSYTYDHVQKNLHFPAILVDGRCAITPWGKRLRIGGTMELSGINNKVLPARMKGIYQSAKDFYPGLDIALPISDKIWHGLRPVTPDGLPYIGNIKKFKNVLVAGGHAMLGISQGTGTGKLISELLSGIPTSVDITAFSPNRYS